MFVLVKSDDWEGLYVNRKLWEEGHHIDLDIIKKACKKFNFDIGDLEEYWVSDKYYENVLSEIGNYPDSFDDVELS